MVREEVRASGKTPADAPEVGGQHTAAAGEGALELELVQRAQQGDRQAVDVLVQQYERLVLLQARRSIRCLHASRAWDPALEPADVEQEAWTNFLELITTYDPTRGVPFPAYIAVKLQWRLANFLRRQRKPRHDHVPFDALYDEALERAAGWLSEDAPSPGDLAAAEARACIAPVLGALSEHRRLLLRHWYLEGLDTDDIAHRFGTTAGAVRMLHRRTLAELRRLISGQRVRKA